jgi:hypothetical protein
MVKAMLAEHWNSLTAWLNVTGSPCPPYSAGAESPSQPPSATCLNASLKTLWRGDAAVVVALAAFEIADAIERLQHFLAELCGFVEDGLAHVGRCVGEPRQIVIAIDLEHVVEQEAHIFHGGFVDWHRVLSANGGLCGEFLRPNNRGSSAEL